MSTKTIYGLYADDDELLDAIDVFNKEGIAIKEVYTPFPVHGLDKALGLKKTRISDAAFFYGLYGVTLASVMTWFMMNHDWPQNIGGKPSFTWFENLPAFIPVMFELTVFCAAHFMSLTFWLEVDCTQVLKLKILIQEQQTINSLWKLNPMTWIE